MKSITPSTFYTCTFVSSQPPPLSDTKRTPSRHATCTCTPYISSHLTPRHPTHMHASSPSHTHRMQQHARRRLEFVSRTVASQRASRQLATLLRAVSLVPFDTDIFLICRAVYQVGLWPSPPLPPSRARGEFFLGCFKTPSALHIDMSLKPRPSLGRAFFF
jgi:hypothetical protein